MNAPLPIKLYNTLTRKVEDFTPVQPGKVGMYLCGITPYGLSHVGNARTMIVFDTFRRFLKAAGYDVKFVRNFTDIDDKIIKRAQDENRSWQSVAQEFIAAFREDMAGLNVEAADEEPLVSDTLPEIVDIIDRLVKKDHAYINTDNQDVVYAIDSFKNYGKLANRKLDEQQAGARVDVEPGKKNPFDFVLWKQAKPGEPSWPSPWGAGRPGWHIECSAMSCKHLDGDKRSFDIHGGGMDLQFPHHECEIAQSEGAYDHRYVNYWMHVAFINMAGEKMSKSLGNIMTVREALEQLRGRAIRLCILQTHYRQPLDFSVQSIEQSQRAYFKLLAAVENVWDGDVDVSRMTRFMAALSNDFGTPQAVAIMFETLAASKKAISDEAKGSLVATLRQMINILGLGGVSYQLEVMQSSVGLESRLSNEQIEQFIEQRTEARKNKDWANSDRIRHELEVSGVIIKDMPDGTTTWERG